MSNDFLVVIPIYNHAATLRQVVVRSLTMHPDVLVVDDGSTDEVAGTLEGLHVRLIRHDHNHGKGKAILTAAAEAKRLGKTYFITLDADGQHDPADIPRLLERASAKAVIVGARRFEGPNVPQISRFGRSFSNFWLRVQTGAVVSDVQCGFRLYPVALFDAVTLYESRFAFEVEVLVKAAWAGFELKSVDISVHYPPASERISHFRKLHDNVTISLLNTRLTARAFMPLPHRQFSIDSQGRVSPIHPLRSLRILLNQNNTPRELGLAAALGMLIGSLPLIGMTSILIIMLTSYFRLSRIAGLAVNQLCMPPLVPALCIEAGHFLRHGTFLTEVSFQTLGYEAMDRLWEWGVGSLAMAPALALSMGLIVYGLALAVRTQLRRVDMTNQPNPDRGDDHG